MRDCRRDRRPRHFSHASGIRVSERQAIVDASTIERGINGLVESCARKHDELGFFADISERLRRLVPFDGAT